MKIENIVLSRPDRIGDVILSSSCLASVQQAYPDAKIYWLIADHLRCLFYKHPAITDFMSIPERGNQDAFVQQLEQFQVDTIIHLNENSLIEQAAEQADIVRRIGFSNTNSPALTQRLPHNKKAGRQLEALYNFELLQCIDVSPPESLLPWLTLDLRAKESLQDKYPTLDKPFAVFHLGAHGDKARIPVSIYTAIADFVIQEHGLDIVLVGTEATLSSEADFLSALPQHEQSITSLSGATRLDETAWLYQHAALAVSRDSGPAHLAAAMDCPTVTLMAEPNDAKCARRWAPLGRYSTVIENDIKQRWWESDTRFAQRNFKLFDIKKIIQQVDGAIMNKKPA